MITMITIIQRRTLLTQKSMNKSVLKYQYFDQKRPRKPSNMPRKCLRRSRKCVIESMSHQWVSHGIEVNVTVALRATRYASFIEIRIILQFHQFRFPGFSGNFNVSCKRFLAIFFRFEDIQTSALP